MPIRYYEGVEGSGKTCMMTKDLALHKKAGGTILAAPGYKLFDPISKDLLCEVLKLEQLVNFHETIGRRKIIIVFDEVLNWFNNHTWQNKLCDLIGAICAQRRKLEAGLFMTGPEFYRLPPVVRELVHEIVHCEDKHRINRSLKRGQYCRYFKEDRRGLFSYPKKPFTTRRTFYMEPWYDWYDTYEITEFLNQNTRFVFAKREVRIDEFGNVINPNDYGESDVESLREYINQHRQTESPLVKAFQGFFNEIQGVSRIPRDVVYRYFKAENKSDKDRIGRLLKSMGAKSIDRTKEYDLSGVSM